MVLRQSQGDAMEPSQGFCPQTPTKALPLGPVPLLHSHLCNSFYHSQWGNGDVVLRNLNLSIPRGKLTVILGPTACGKTSLVNTMLGKSSHF